MHVCSQGEARDVGLVRTLQESDPGPHRDTAQREEVSYGGSAPVITGSLGHFPHHWDKMPDICSLKGESFVLAQTFILVSWFPGRKAWWESQAAERRRDRSKGRRLTLPGHTPSLVPLLPGPPPGLPLAIGKSCPQDSVFQKACT